MAATLRLVLEYGSTEVLDLLAGHVRIRPGGWTPQTGTPGEPVWETFELVARDTTDANLLTELYNIQDFISGARRYAQSLSTYEEPHYLGFMPTGGTTQVYSLIVDGNLEMPAEGKLSALLGKAGQGYIRMSLARMPWWEIGANTVDSTSGVGINGGIYAATTDISGDLPPTVSQVFVYSVTSATASIDDIWIGVRPTNEGVSNFNPIWPAEMGTLGTDAATASDATAINGYRVTVSFATTATWQLRNHISVSQIESATAEIAHYTGEYLVLGRLKLSAAISAATDRIGLRLYQSLKTLGSDDIKVLTGETVLTSDNANHTNWAYYELGTLSIPVCGLRFGQLDGDMMEESSSLQLWAERQGTSASLYIDSYILVPNQNIVIIKNANLATEGSYVVVRSTPLGDTFGYRFSNVTSLLYGIEYNPGSMEWPVDDGYVILVAQEHDNSELSHTCRIKYMMKNRYSLYRVAT